MIFIDKIINCAYSIDMLRLEYKLKLLDLSSFLKKFEYRTDVKYYENFKTWSYRHCFVFSVGLNDSYTLLADFNNSKKSENKVVIVEFNPNKVGSDLGLIELLVHLKSLSYKKPRVVRFDLAIDLPVARERCSLIKDQRTYQQYKNSESDFTEYLGARSSHGYVKLYNKARELKIDCDLTRLELTIDYDKRCDIDKIFPKVLTLYHYQVDFSVNKLTGTDKVLLLSCIDKPEYLTMLSRDKRKKIEDLIRSCSSILTLDLKMYLDTLNDINKYI